MDKKTSVIGQNLKEIRKAKMIDLVDVSKALGWSISKISKIENNKQDPLFDDVEKLAEFYGISIDKISNKFYPIGSNLNIQDLKNKFKMVSNLYDLSVREAFVDSKVGKIVTKEIPATITNLVNLNRERFLVTGSVGKGQYAEIPWISIFDRRITESATKGVYIVYLYKADASALFLSLNQGFTYFKDKFGSKVGRNQIRKMAGILREKTYIPEDMQLYTIDLKAEKSLGKGYMAGHIAGKYYDIKKLPDDHTLVADLLKLIEVYNNISNQIGNRTIEQFYDYLISISEGNITEEAEIDSTNDLEEQNGERDIDHPEEKRDPVIDAGGRVVYLRSPKASIKALKLANYMCEYDNNHYSFEAKNTNHMYVESHHLVPISQSKQFGYSLDVPANICSLCANCHKCIHLASNAEKEKILKKLFNERKDRLKKAGIHIDFQQLKKFYNLD